MEKKTDTFYLKPGPHLEQGDIFRIELVAPMADRQQRIFRTTDGRHGSVVFEGSCGGRVFSRGDLESLLNRSSPDALRTQPFVQTPDGHAEMVVVYARLLRYFVIATQTCDISGEEGGRSPLDWACVLPFIPLADMCKYESLEVPGHNEPMTVHEYVSTNCDPNGILENVSDAEYGKTMRQLIKKWLETATKKNKQGIGAVRKLLNDPDSKGFLFYLRADIGLQMPEGVVDFTAIFTVPREDLENLQQLRIARIGPAHREKFSQAFGNFFSRIATLEQIKPDKV